MDRMQMLRLLCEGQSPEVITRDGAADLVEVSVLKANAGRASLWYQDKTLCNLAAGHIHLTASRSFDFPDGGLWTWLALDAENKLILSWALGAREGGIAALFLDDVLSRSAVPARVTTDDSADEVVELAVTPHLNYPLLDRVFGPAC
ncbi:MAG TPA: hypothetical protein VN685_02010, partial [Rhizomicrobium sp.]|nr:hypothetical protein [Rhizomicrobium sp.]